MRALLALLLLAASAEAFKYHIGPRLESGERERYANLVETAEINARMPAVHFSTQPTVRGTSKPSRALLHFNVAALATDWWKQYSIDEADLELTLGQVVCKATYEVVKLMTPAGNLSGATWDCPYDPYLQDFGSECQSFWEGGAYSTYLDEESSIKLEASDSFTTVRVPITGAARGNPEFLMVKRATEKTRGSSTGNEGNKCRLTILGARVAIRTYALNPTTQRRIGDRVPEGCRFTPKTITVEGQSLTLSAYWCPTTRDIPDGAKTHTMVRTLGVPWQDGAFLDTGIYTAVGDEIFISQRCQGPSECKLGYRNVTNGVDIRGETMTRLLFDDPNGFRLQRGTVAINGQDQGSLNNLAFTDNLISKNRLHDLTLLTDFEGWSGLIWCLCELQKLGQCVTGFASACFGGAGLTFLKDFSQDGGYEDLNPATSTSTFMHLTLNYFYGYNRTNPFCGGPAEAALRARNPAISAAAQQCNEFSYDGFLNHRIEEVSAQEIAFAQSFWAEGAPEWQEKRLGSGAWFPESLIETSQCPEINGTTNPGCDQSFVQVRELGTETYRSTGVQYTKLVHTALTNVGTALSQQPANGRPGVDATYFISSVWKGLFAPFDFADAAVVDGKFTGFRGCFGPAGCPIPGMCEEGRCPTGGHSTFGNFPVPPEEAFEIRRANLRTSSHLNRVMNELGTHADPNSGSNNARAWAKAWESAVVGRLETEAIDA